MENVTTGHWVFAGIFLAAFIAYLVWSYRKDLKLHKQHYGGTIYVAIAIVLICFTYYVFKSII